MHSFLHFDRDTRGYVRPQYWFSNRSPNLTGQTVIRSDQHSWSPTMIILIALR